MGIYTKSSVPRDGEATGFKRRGPPPLPPRTSPTPTPAPKLTNALEKLREEVEAMMEARKPGVDSPPWDLLDPDY